MHSKSEARLVRKIPANDVFTFFFKGFDTYTPPSTFGVQLP
jgi:hypothetical protein